MSPWSETCSLGKDAHNETFTHLEAPVISNPKLVEDNEGSCCIDVGEDL
ncbi:MAG: hypothetical protein GX144_10665 [Clostridiaceae bacterium]|nr:hypothetical protein [Clostridiaceae bacterium]